jgi:glycosyltransferase involved in cell wall biosynthesis
MRPLISILIPVYNSARFVAAALDSALAQTYERFEVVIVDDASTDGSLEILQPYAQRDARVRLFTHARNLGLPSTRNEAVQEARGEFIANLDSDDTAAPDRLALQLRYLQAHPECIVLGGQATFVDEDGDPVGVSEQKLSHEEIEAELFDGRGLALLQTTSMMRRADVLTVGGYRQGLRTCEEHDLFLRLGEHGRLANLPDVLGAMRKHPGSFTAIGHIEISNALRRAVIADALRRRGLPLDSRRPRHWPAPQSLAEWHATWAGEAFYFGYRRSGWKHLRRAFRNGPLCPAALRILVDALLGPGARPKLRKLLQAARLRPQTVEVEHA